MFYQVSELALKCNVSKDTIRYYAKIGLLHPNVTQAMAISILANEI